MSNLHISVIPRISEKTYAQSQHNIYVFNVPMTANKQQIAAAVAEQFNVTVTTVNVVIAKGKVIRGVRRGKAVTGQRTDKKKAYVTLKSGDTIPVFDQQEESK
jgi:large subunit ribosomal protein L23